MKNRVRLIIAALCFLLIIIATRSQAPSIISLTPPTAVVGTAGITLTITGQAFTSHSVAYWNGSSRTTTFVSANQITAAITTADLAAPGSAQITVEDSVSGLVSIPVIFNVLGQLATVTSWSPTQFTAGSTINVNVYGQQFAPNATVLFDWIPETTTFVSSTQLIATVNGGDIGYSGQHKIAVYNGAIPTSPATAQFSPRPVSFGAVTQGTTSGVVTVTLRNSGGASLTLGTPYFTITGANAADFSNTGAGSCANGGTVTGSGGTCTITLTFTPSTSASESANLNVSDSAVGSPQVIALSGVGTSGSPSFTPTLTFGNVTVNTTSGSQSAIAANGGATSFTFSTPAVNITGTNAADFSITGQTCTNGLVLTVGSTCSVTIVFTPTSAALESATLNFNDSLAGSPQTTALSGTGVAVTGAPNLSPNTINFGTVVLGSSSSTFTTTFTNGGSGSVTLATPYYAINRSNTNTPATDFTNTGGGTCSNGAVITSGSTCTIVLQFTPSSSIVETATLAMSITSGPRPTPAAALSGMGSGGGPPAVGELLQGCTVNSSNVPNWGSGTCPSGVPSGWTLVCADSAETTLPSNEFLGGGTSVSTAQAHTGTHSYKGFYSGDGTNASIGCGSLTPFTELYGSFWDRPDSNALFPNSDYQYFWLDGVGACPNGTGVGIDAELFTANVASTLNASFYPVGTGGSACPEAFAYHNGAVLNIQAGTWSQYEYHLVPSTSFASNVNPLPNCNNLSPSSPGCGNGSMQFYVNGVLVINQKNANLNLTAAAVGPLILGGYITSFRSDYLNGSGETRCTRFGIDSNTGVTCPGTQPGTGAPQPFNRYGDDYIVLKR